PLRVHCRRSVGRSRNAQVLARRMKCLPRLGFGDRAETDFFEIERRLSLLTMLNEWAAFDVADIFLNGGSVIVPRVTFMFPTTTERSSVVFGSIQSNQWMNGNLRVK